MSDWNLTIESPDIPYSFWSFSRHGQGRNTYRIIDATLGVYQTHPLNFKSTKDALIIEGANNPSKQIIKWIINDKGRLNSLSASINSVENSDTTTIEITYASQKYSFELKNMEQNQKLYSISKTDLDLIIRKNLQMNMIFDVLTLICEYSNCIFNMNNNINLLKYQELQESKTPNIIDTINATRNSYVSLDMENEIINGDYDKFMVECECKPYFEKNMNIAGVVSLHGPGTGWELRITNYTSRPHCKFEWVFTTQWMEADSTEKKWMHNELLVDVVKNDIDDWIYLKGEYDFHNGLQLFTVNGKTISRKIKGKPQIESGRSVEFGRGYASKDRIYYGLIRNVKIDGWDAEKESKVDELDVKIDSKNTEEKQEVESKSETKVTEALNVISNYNDKNLEQETKIILSSLTKDELNRLKSKLDNDIKQNNSKFDPKLYQYLSNMIDNTEKDSNIDILEVKTDSKNVEKKEELVDKAQRVDEENEEKEISYKLQEIIERKDEKIQRMIAINNQQTELIKSLSEEDNISDGDINQCLKILNNLINNLIKSFDIKYSMDNINEIGENDINNLTDNNSEFNNELNKYSQALKVINLCSNKLNNSIDNIKQYINNKYIPNEQNYKQWKLNDIILWIKVLENGRYIKYLDVLSFGFKESEISNGEILPDLNTADLAVTPFNIKKFKDRHDLIKHFKRLSSQ